MTNIASSLNAVPIEHRQNPAGYTAKATTQFKNGLTCREEYALPNVTEFCSVVNEGQGRASEGASRTPHIGMYPQPFETVFPDPDIDAWEDYRDATQAALTAITRVLMAFVCAGIGTLIWVNLIY